MNCNVCNQDKEANEFQTYWHRTQQKMRTRRQCTKCLYDLKLKRKDPEKYYSNNPNYRKCYDCNEWKLVETEFYPKDTGHTKHRCRPCTLIKDRALRKTHRDEELADSCGSEKVIAEPNQYRDIYQKECTFFILDALGYKFDEPTGIWTKPGYKEIKDGKPIFPTLNLKSIIYKRNKISPTKLDRMLGLREQGLSYEKIAAELGISDTAVYKNIKKWKQNQ